MSGLSLQDALKERVLVLDGAMGTMVQRYKLGESDYRTERFKDHPVNVKGNNDLLSITQPFVIQDIHRQYLEAGADIIETCTFGAQRISQSEYRAEHLVREMNLAAAHNARQAIKDFLSKPENADKQAWVAGSIGPTGKTLSMSPDVEDASVRSITFDEMVEAYLEQILALQEGGVDFFLIETVFDALNAKAAIYALDLAKEKTGQSLPLMISVTIADKSGRTLCGQTLEAFWASVCHAKPLLVGMNCALGAEEMAPHLQSLNSLVNCGISCYPNAGLPNAEGGYDETPEHMAGVLADYIKKGWLNLVGGCCGTSPDYIRAIAQAVKGLQPRAIPEVRPTPALLSGLELYRLPEKSLAAQPNSAASFTMIGERCNLSGSAKFARLIRSKDYEAALAIARRQVENGANVIDINLDDSMHNSVQEMEHFLRLLTSEPDIASVPIMLDSSHWEVLVAGLKSLAGRSLVNSISLKEGEAEFKRKALEIRRLGGLPVIMCFDEKGQGDTLERKKEIVDRACHILIDELGLAPSEIVLDLAVLSVATGIESHASYGLDFIEAVAYVNKVWPGVMTNGGISNVSFSLRGNNPAREAMHAVFLHYACRAGLTMGIVNAGMLKNYDEIAPDLRQAVEDVILNKDPEAAERLLEVAERHRADSSAAVVSSQDDWRKAKVGERLKNALVRGLTDYLAEDIKEAIAEGMTPLQVVEQALMGGMRHVGELFGSGKMFLPQVVKSARVMKKAVACLEPYFADSQNGQELRGRILMATVKGDVHDIGKNIVSVVLGCNGFQVEDLGVMVPESDIVTKAIETKAQMIGLSALITPSLDEIVNVVKCLEDAGVRIPVMVGGAATSPIHTAVKIAPYYSGLVIYVPDASLVTEVVNNILNSESKSTYEAAIRSEQEALREQWQNRLHNLELHSFAEACKRSPHFNWQVSSDIAQPQDPSVKVVDFDLRELSNYVNWQEFLAAWGLKGLYPDILNDAELGDKANKLYADGRSVLEYIMRTKALKVRGIYGFWPANSSGEDILIYAKESDVEPTTILPTLRQQAENLEVCLALADFIAPKECGRKDWLGMFAVSSGAGLPELKAKYEEQNDEYHALMVGFLADRLCEAAAECLHKKVRSICGYADPDNISMQDILLHHTRGIRPAPGYPSCPDHSNKALIWHLLKPTEHIGVCLTDSYALSPASSICGFYFSAPWARYFSLGKISREQAEDYSKRCGRTLPETERWLGTNLGYEP